MQYPGYNSGQVAFSEGNWFPFKIHNLIQLQDNNWYFVLMDTNGLKHFLSAEYYKNFNFQTGDVISCRIDKINCTGRIFLEPKHPYYIEGEIYSFDVLTFIENQKYGVLVVKDIFENRIEMQQELVQVTNYKVKKKVRCLVISIKKGTPNLELFTT